MKSPNHHGYFHGSWYHQQLDTMEWWLGLLSEILDSELRMQRGPGDTPFLSLPVQVATLEMPISQVACGTEHATAITVEGRLYCWGGGDWRPGQTGDRERGGLPHATVSGCSRGQTRTLMGQTAQWARSLGRYLIL